MQRMRQKRDKFFKKKEKINEKSCRIKEIRHY